MPKITEYTPEVDASGPQGGIDPNLEQVSKAGAGLQAFGRDVGDANDVVQNRIQQMESSDAFAKVTDLKEKYLEQIQQQTADGTIDVGKVKQQYQDDIDQLGQAYDTPQGKDAFNRYATRSQGILIQKAMTGQTIVARNNAVNSFQDSLNTNANIVHNDPSLYGDTLNSTIENIHDLNQQGLIPASQLQQTLDTAKNTIGFSAIKGHAQLDPEATKADLDSGKFNDQLTPAQLQEAYQAVKVAQTTRQTGQLQAITLAKAVQEEQARNWQNSEFPKVLTNSLKPQDLVNAPLSFGEKMNMLNIIQRANSGAFNIDPGFKNSITQRMLSPDSDPNHISDPSQLQQYVAQGKLSPQDYQQMTSWFDKTPQGQTLTANRKQLLDLAKAKLVNSNTYFGQKDPDGQYNLMQFTNALQTKEADLRSQNQPVNQLYDVKSPNFFGNQIQSFVPDPQQKFRNQAAQGIGAPPPSVYQSIPGVPSVPPQQEPLVNMLGPKGEKVKVPKSQVSKALKSGYEER